MWRCDTQAKSGRGLRCTVGDKNVNPQPAVRMIGVVADLRACPRVHVPVSLGGDRQPRVDGGQQGGHFRRNRGQSQRAFKQRRCQHARLSMLCVAMWTAQTAMSAMESLGETALACAVDGQLSLVLACSFSASSFLILPRFELFLRWGG